MSLNANQFTTDKVRLSYVHLNQPHSSAPDGSNPKYGVTILLPKSDVATKARLDAAYQAAVNAGVGAKWNGVMPPKIESPIYDGDGVRPNGEPFGAECKGHWVFTAGNKNPVPIVWILVRTLSSMPATSTAVCTPVCAYRSTPTTSPASVGSAAVWRRYKSWRTASPWAAMCPQQMPLAVQTPMPVRLHLR